MEAVLHRKLQQYRRQGRGSPDLSGVRQAAAYQVIKELHEEHRWPVYKLCAAAGVSRAGYYKWLNRAVSQKKTEDEKLAGVYSVLVKFVAPIFILLIIVASFVTGTTLS